MEKRLMSKPDISNIDKVTVPELILTVLVALMDAFIIGYLFWGNNTQRCIASASALIGFVVTVSYIRVIILGINPTNER